MASLDPVENSHETADHAPIIDLASIRNGSQDPLGEATERQHSKGKLTADERVELLLDEGSFTEVGPLVRHRGRNFDMDKNRPHGDGVITGWGTIEGRPVAVYAYDFRVFGGTLGAAAAQKIHRLLDLASDSGVPVISLNDGGGARIQEGAEALDGYGGIFRRSVGLSGVVPQISAVLGPSAGGAAYAPALTDFIFMVRRTSTMYITGPAVIETVTGEVISHEELGGADTHGRVSGVADFVHQDEAQCIETIRLLLSYLPSNNLETPPVEDIGDPPDRPCKKLPHLLPTDQRASYDVRLVIAEIVDYESFLEVSPGYAGNLVCGFARLAGHAIGIVANQPGVLAGVLDIRASEKGARFVRSCDVFNIPILTLVDVPGFLPGRDQEHGGIIRHGAKLLYAYCEATVPRVSVVMRKAYGGAYIVMDSKSVGADVTLAWPTNEIAVMGGEGAINILYRRELAASQDPDVTRAELLAHYRQTVSGSLAGPESGLIDNLIDPVQTRKVVARSFDLMRNKREKLPQRKHANMPL